MLRPTRDSPVQRQDELPLLVLMLWHFRFIVTEIEANSDGRVM